MFGYQNEKGRIQLFCLNISLVNIEKLNNLNYLSIAEKRNVVRNLWRPEGVVNVEKSCSGPSREVKSIGSSDSVLSQRPTHGRCVQVEYVDNRNKRFPTIKCSRLLREVVSVLFPQYTKTTFQTIPTRKARSTVHVIDWFLGQPVRNEKLHTDDSWHRDSARWSRIFEMLSAA